MRVKGLGGVFIETELWLRSQADPSDSEDSTAWESGIGKRASLLLREGFKHMSAFEKADFSLHLYCERGSRSRGLPSPPHRRPYYSRASAKCSFALG